jgi:prepilin signal peptidase PulO-like enzyme (type II secretory pathway)
VALSTFVHVLKRLLLATCGYLVALIVGLVAAAFIYGVASTFPGAPDHFAVMSLGAFFMLMAPPIGVFVLAVAVAATITQTLLTTLISELFALRAAWVHMLFGAIVSASGFTLISDTLEDLTTRSFHAEVAIFTAGGLVGGLVYWLIAGRAAGFRRPASLQPPLADFPQ